MRIQMVRCVTSYFYYCFFIIVVKEKNIYNCIHFYSPHPWREARYLPREGLSTFSVQAILITNHIILIWCIKIILFCFRIPFTVKWEGIIILSVFFCRRRLYWSTNPCYAPSPTGSWRVYVSHMKLQIYSKCSGRFFHHPLPSIHPLFFPSHSLFPLLINYFIIYLFIVYTNPLILCTSEKINQNLWIIYEFFCY